MREIDAGDFSAALFHGEIVPAYRPVVFRGLLKHWPVVHAARKGPETLSAYLKRFDSGIPVLTKTAPPLTKGRFFYDADVSGFNYRMEKMKIGDALDALLSLATDDSPPAFAIQSLPTPKFLPGFNRENRLPMLPDSAVPRVWIGNAVTVSAHYDAAENVACCVAGRRRFTLFPPEQARNLYPGPFELTPAGPIVSMVDFDAPNLDRYPLFGEAMAAALVVDLEPGDALYVPYIWWHHVRSLERVNMLVNFWWKPWAPPGLAVEAMLLAMLAIKDLPESRRNAWRALFGHYVFGDNGPPGTHLPVDRRGIQGKLTREDAAALRSDIAQKLAPHLVRMPPIVKRLRRLVRALPWRR